MSSQSDRIEKEILVRAPRSRVWRALVDADQFGTWFHAKLEGQFAAGRPVRGRITTPGYERLEMVLFVERIDEAASLFSFRWHPYAVDLNRDYSGEPTTLVEFRLADAPEGTLVRVIESGFDRIPAARRSEAFRMNSEGWQEQMENIKRHVEAQ